MNNIFKNLLLKLSKAEYSLDKNLIADHCIDWRRKYKGSSEIIFFPKSVLSIIKIVKFCFKRIFQLFLKVGTLALSAVQFLD